MFEFIEEKTIQRFWSKVNKDGDCWLWTASLNHKGYGQFVIQYDLSKHRPFRAHRVSWMIHNGSIPDGLMVLHSCDTPACVNPLHLFLGTADDNSKDMMAKGRHRFISPTPIKGENHHNSKLTEEKVAAIRKDFADGAKQFEIAEKYELSRVTVFNVVRRQTWKDL